jgi:thiamine-phosphate diphosphorylase
VLPRLHVIADRGRSATDGDFVALLAELSQALVPVAAALHVRIKSASGPELAVVARQATRSLSLAGRPVLLNGAAEQAVALGYEGAHLPQALIPLSAPAAPPGFLLGASVHDLSSLAAAANAGTHYVFFGPVWSPGSKIAKPTGVSALASFARRSSVPLIAIGGVTPERVAACLEAGAHGVAVVSAIIDASDRRAAIAAFDAALLAQPGA